MKRVNRIPREAEQIFPTQGRTDCLDVPFLRRGLVNTVYVAGDTFYFTTVEHDMDYGTIYSDFVADNDDEVAALRAAIAARAAAAERIARENARAIWWLGRPE